jgi:hypothetical protein
MNLNPLSWIIDAWSSHKERKARLKEADMEIQLAEKQNRARLLQSESDNNHEWEMANLTDKDKWLRRISFTMFSAPFIWALFDPSGVKAYFEVALDAMPEWYIQLYAGMVGGVWGFAALKNSVPAIIGGIKKALSK